MLADVHEVTVEPEPSPGETPAAAAPGYAEADDKARVLARLKRIEGQVRGLSRQVEQDTYCIDVLTQVAATTRALQGVALLLLDDHVRHCVADDVRHGSDEKVAEAMDAIARLVRS